MAELECMISKTLIYARHNRPAENDLPLKDKALSPKRKKKKNEKCAQFSGAKMHLPLRGDKKRKKKRFGIGAENCEQAANINIASNGSVKEKGNVKKANNPTIIDMTAFADDALEDKTPPWLTIQGINLSSKLCKILMDPQCWLTDKHVDAAQRLLKSMKPRIEGLNDVVIMTHFKKTRVNIATKDLRTIQCHNIGGHWVVSTSICGKVTVYESLSTVLNNTLLQQLVHLYQICCDNINKHLMVTVILQQQQRGFCD